MQKSIQNWSSIFNAFWRPTWLPKPQHSPNFGQHSTHQGPTRPLLEPRLHSKMGSCRLQIFLTSPKVTMVSCRNPIGGATSTMATMVSCSICSQSTITLNNQQLNFVHLGSNLPQFGSSDLSTCS